MSSSYVKTEEGLHIHGHCKYRWKLAAAWMEICAQNGGWEQTKANPNKETNEVQQKRKQFASKSIVGLWV